MKRESGSPAAPLRLSFRRARLVRISAELERWRDAAAARSVVVMRPAHGWIRHIRDALNMNGFQLARRLGIRQPTVARLEQKERDETITLRALRRAANGLGCDLVYALVPRTSLPEMLEAQVRRAVAAAAAGSAGADVTPEELVRELLVRMPRWIWGSYDYPALYDAIEKQTE